MSFVHPDKALAKRLLAGDEASFRQVFDLYFPKLYRFALAQLGGNQEEAKEVVQQTFCKALEAMDSYRGEASLYGWMRRICHNSIIDWARRRRFELPVSDAPDWDATMQGIIESLQSPTAEQPESQAAQRSLRQLIQATLDVLPGRYGDVLEWKYVEDLSVNEIASRLDVGPKAAESLLTRARNAFRSAIIERGEVNDVLLSEVTLRARG